MTSKTGTSIQEPSKEVHIRDPGSTVAGTGACRKLEGFIALPSGPCGLHWSHYEPCREAQAELE